MILVDHINLHHCDSISIGYNETAEEDEETGDF